MNFLYKSQECLKNFREIGLVGPCFEKSVATNKLIAKLATMPPIGKGSSAVQPDRKTQKLASYSKAQTSKVKTNAPRKTITYKNPISTREL